MEKGTYLALATIALALASFGRPAVPASADRERTVSEVRFERGHASAVIEGRIKGYHFADYQLRAGAGQTLKVGMKGSNGANYVNVIAPGAGDVAMYIGQFGANRFEGILPIEGVYTLRVYLMRSAARRNETSDYTIDVAITGKPLRPVSGKVDARLPGTPFHARAPIDCAVPYQPEVENCEAFVIRRDFEGTATVEVRGPKSYLRRVLFVKGKPVASDSTREMSVSRRGDVTEVQFEKDERVEVVDALLTGG